jgi:hypothetical protein
MIKKDLELKENRKKENSRTILFEMIGSGREKLIRIRMGNTDGQIKTFEIVI